MGDDDQRDVLQQLWCRRLRRRARPAVRAAGARVLRRGMCAASIAFVNEYGAQAARSYLPGNRRYPVPPLRLQPSQPKEPSMSNLAAYLSAPVERVNIGTEIAYRRFGRGPAIVLIHGWPLNGATWRG